jgi:tetratricopeptide (TPR) repeat protein
VNRHLQFLRGATIFLDRKNRVVRMKDTRVRLAAEFFEKAYKLQMQGQLELAAQLYLRSIELNPTAEAHTFLGWTYRFQGKLEEAIAECKRGIEVDPTLGNPYNDIGAYLIELGRPAEAVPWLEKATVSTRYATYHFAWYNLGRAHAALQMYRRALECFAHALDIDPEYAPALEAEERIRRLQQ